MNDVPRIIASMHVNPSMRAYVMREDVDDKKRREGVIELRIVQIGGGLGLGPGGLPLLRAETTTRKDALGQPVWEPAALPIEIVLAVLGQALLSVEVEAQKYQAAAEELQAELRRELREARGRP